VRPQPTDFGTRRQSSAERAFCAFLRLIRFAVRVDCDALTALDIVNAWFSQGVVAALLALGYLVVRFQRGMTAGVR